MGVAFGLSRAFTALTVTSLLPLTWFFAREAQQVHTDEDDSLTGRVGPHVPRLLPTRVHVCAVRLRNTISSLPDCLFAPQSAGGEWSGTHREEPQPVSPPLLFHLIMWNNFISLCGNSSLVPNCGARRTRPEQTAERKGNNWSSPCLAHRFLLAFIIIVSFTEGDCTFSFRHFMSAAPLCSRSLSTCFFPFSTVAGFYHVTQTPLSASLTQRRKTCQERNGATK